MTKHSWIIAIVIIGVIAVAGAFVFPKVFATKLDEVSTDTQQSSTPEDVVQTNQQGEATVQLEESIDSPRVTHLPTPQPLRAFYMSSWTASSVTRRSAIIKQISETNINAVVIDIKDDTGRVSFLIDDPAIAQTGSPVNRIRDIDALIAELHEKNIYVIGRISVFQDPYLAVHNPDWAIRSNSTGGVWKDRKGLSFLSPTSRDVWEYIIALARASHERGFDEINFDYVRFPSDGIISDIAYPNIQGKTRADFLEDFFVYLGTEMKASNIPTSADLFGMTTTSRDDLGIGQVLERALPHFDYIAPMVYPSHYPKQFIGIANPASEPYRIVHYAMSSAVTRAKAIGYEPEKFRTWIQDFNLGATYTASMISDQITASETAGVTSWMVWDPSNTYTLAAYRQN